MKISEQKFNASKQLILKFLFLYKYMIYEAFHFYQAFIYRKWIKNYVYSIHVKTSKSYMKFMKNKKLMKIVRKKCFK